MSYRKPMSFWTFNFLGLSTYDSIMIFTPNILVDYQDGLLSLGPVGPWGGWGHNFKNVCTIQHPWFYPDFCAKHLGEFSSLIVVFGPKAQLLKCVNTPIFLILSWFLCQTVGGVIKLDCCLWALRGVWIAQILKKCLYTSTFFILSWFCAKNLGECSSWIVVCEGGRAQFLKCMYNSTFLILSLFLCQTFGGLIKSDCYLWALLSPEGGRAQFLKCVYNSKFLILSWFLCQTFEGVIKFPLGHWFPVKHHDF